MNARVKKLRLNFQENNIDSMLVCSPENRRYLSGFTGSAGYLLISENEAVLVTDFRYIEQADSQASDFRVERVSGSLDWFPILASRLGVQRIGFESMSMTVATFSSLKTAIDDARGSHELKLLPISGVVERLRAFKDEVEMALLTKAVEIADEALDQVTSTIEAGMTEKEVAWQLEREMRERDAEAIAFDIIVGAGPNGALPHHRAGEKIIGDGEAVVIDMGATYQGYCSDLTRTVVVGEPDETFREIYSTVLRAQLAAEEFACAGMTGATTDAIARDIIASAGYGDAFGHSLGHGVGLAVHEFPTLGQKSGDILEDGMVFTIEPGIYLSGWGGVRIEDIAVMENGRPRVITKARKLEL